MIIVEGPDGGGKTTLIGQLEERYGLKREPRAVSSDVKSLVPIGEYVDAELTKGFGWRLYDRFALISSPFYMFTGPDRTFRDEMTDPLWLEMAWRKFLAIDPVIIICLPKLEVVKANVFSDPNNARIAGHIEEIYYSYLNFLAQQKARFNSSVMLWNYQDPNEKNLDGLIRWAKAREKKGIKWTD